MTYRIYKPYKPDQPYGSRSPVKPDRCAVEVDHGMGGWTKWSQCTGPAKYDGLIDGQQVKVCGTHRPAAINRRENQKRAREEREERAWRRKMYRPGEYRAALQKIADGHNDPRALAREVLAKWEDQ